MLDIESFKMLYYLTNKEYNPQGNMKFVTFYENYEKHSGKPEHRIMACLRYLERKGFIRYTDDHLGFELEYKGYKKVLFATNEVFSFLVQSFLVPVFVSVFTAWLTIVVLKRLGLQ